MYARLTSFQGCEILPSLFTSLNTLRLYIVSVARGVPSCSQLLFHLSSFSAGRRAGSDPTVSDRGRGGEKHVPNTSFLGSD